MNTKKKADPAISKFEKRETDFMNVAERRIHTQSDDICPPPATTQKYNVSDLFTKTEVLQLGKILNKNSPENL